MEVSQTMDTEELMTLLQIQFYHPQQASRGLYSRLPLAHRHMHPAEDPLRLGRDTLACTFALADTRVSRKQLALQAFRTPRSPDLQFSLQNLSQKGHLVINGSVLGYLEKAELPNKALVRFAEYEMLIRREPGEAKSRFEVEFGVLTVPPSRELGLGVPNMMAVMDTGLGHSTTNGLPAELRSQVPSECDETLMYQS